MSHLHLARQQNDDRLTVQDALAQAAPQPRAAFQADLAARLNREFQAQSFPQPSLPRHVLPRRAVLLVAALLVVSVGVVVALSTAFQQFLSSDDGLSAIYAAGQGHDISVSQTIDGYTVTVEWAYADGNRLTLAYLIQAPSGGYTNLHSDARTHLYQQGSGAEIPMSEGMTGLLSSSGDFLAVGDRLETDRTLSVFTHDLGGFALSGETALAVRFELGVFAVRAAQRTQTPDAVFNDLNEGPQDVFVLNFSIPLVDELRVFATPLTAVDQNIPLTLRRVSITPSQVRVALCFVPPTTDRAWTAMPHLTTSSGAVAGGGATEYVSGIGEAAGETCTQFTYNAGLFDYAGAWKLQLSELVGIGSTGGDQQRIAGTWAFDFVVP